ncbi:sigma-70 family RNA polymerase sigma factor [Aquimarina sp. 2201CG5-10]|uniref:RNA polymerase sigma factor n=1 Tax=Aquimarina callyspongiae TaxID=3098150 RepID=UPI002AB5BDB2|nr:sigma-70 family RNA polymerase sigma factor [Aquimarina sp. 2201CG5-10]MDY8138476.1 sigma-70 family RNA polymerase sigma factor [Aquimarina sp. 2201CG5-10]
MNRIEDQEIIEGIVNGDELIIKDFYKNNLHYISSYILQNSGREEDVEDVFQDALVFMYQKLRSGSLEIDGSTLKTYFYAVCKNIWRNRLRKNKKLTFKEDMLTIVESIEDSIIEEIENKEREHLFRKCFLKLNDTCRVVLSLVFEGKSMKEISEKTGYSEGYTRKKKFECKKSLIEMIEKDPMYIEVYLTSEKQ